MIELKDIRLPLDGELKTACARKLRIPASDVLEARLLLADCVRRVIAISLSVIGVTAPEKM